jgi:YVTN family beta-propeller protein
VIDPSENKLLGVIRLGDPVPGALSPLYKGQLLVHGMGYSPDSKTLAVVSVGSNSVTLIDTATNKVKGVVYVGRSPHEAFFTPNGRELWATVRGENYVSVIDPQKMKEIRRIEVANGPRYDHVRTGRQVCVCVFQLHSGTGGHRCGVA